MCGNDIMTQADLQIQKTLYHNLRNLYPELRIICEEDENDIPEYIKPNLYPERLIKLRDELNYFTNERIFDWAEHRKFKV